MISDTLWAAAGLSSAATPETITAAPASMKLILGIIVYASFPALKRARPGRGSSNSFRKSDCHPATRTDRRRQERIAECPCRARFSRAVPMLHFLGAELGDVGR